jgi:pimeloyl-ACP methyl ester carboxylesterase
MTIGRGTKTMKYLKINGEKIAYTDVGAGTPVLFVHGTPSSSEEFSEVVAQLSLKYRCVALDHLGFGQSDKPEEGDYSISAHTARLRQLIEYLKITAFHLVAHDFGGIISLPLVTGKPTNLLSLTLLNTWGWPMELVDTRVKKQKWLMTSNVMKFCYLRLNFSAKILVKMAWGKHRPLSKEKHMKYQARFRTPSERMGTWGFLQSLFNKEDPAWHQEKKLSVLKDKPILILWGENDKLISKDHLERWKSHFPSARVRTFPEVGHFVADEAPELVGRELLDFLDLQPK